MGASASAAGGKGRFDSSKLVGTFRGSLTTKYDIIKQLGKGAQGAAYLVKNRETDIEYVAKETYNMTEEGKEQFLEEFNKMAELKHPNCCKVLELVQGRNLIEGEWRDEIFVISELAKGSDLFNFTKQAIETKAELTEEWIASVFRQAMQGVAYIHSKGIVHNDLKPDNILVLEEFSPDNPSKVPWVAINDFGCATLASDRGFICGDPRYQSPEAWKVMRTLMAGGKGSFRKLSDKADVWSMGATLYQLVSGGIVPFIYRNISLGALTSSAEDMAKLGDAIIQSEVEVDAYCTNLSTEGKELMLRMLRKDVNKRISAEEVLQSDWFGVQGKPLNGAVVENFKIQATKGRAHRILLNAIANKIQRDHYEHCFAVFAEVDVDNSGYINLKEFHQAYGKLFEVEVPGMVGNCRRSGLLHVPMGEGPEVPPHIEQLFQQADVDGGGQLDFNEFLAVTFDFSSLDPQVLENTLKELFDDFDKDRTGSIDKNELCIALQDAIPKPEFEEVFKRIDKDCDGLVSNQELKDFLFEPPTQEDITKYELLPTETPVTQMESTASQATVMEKVQEKLDNPDECASWFGGVVLPVLVCVFCAYHGIVKLL